LVLTRQSCTEAPVRADNNNTPQVLHALGSLCHTGRIRQSGRRFALESCPRTIEVNRPCLKDGTLRYYNIETLG
jgi:hypothetical protein